MLEIGQLVDGKYKVLNKIGQGGMSVVYLAMNERANKQWAIKEVRKDGVVNFDTVKQGLIAETELLKKLNHPHLPSIIDVIDDKESFLIVMDYIEGVSLSSKLKELGVIPQEDVIDWGIQLCDVLGYLHSREKPIIYRDMKPSNVMLKPDGNVMLIDFGTAREYKSNSSGDDTIILGTKGYAAPEQYGGHGQTDARTDIYCLGATLYHLVTGHNPSEYPYEMYPIRQWDPSLSSGLEAIIIKCTQKNPNDRYQTCAELMYALEHYRDFDIETLKQVNKKWKSFVAVSLASLICFGGAVGMGIKNSRDAEWSFQNNIDTAESYEDFDKLLESANIHPKSIEPYNKAIEIIDKDTVFTSQENTALKSTLLDQSNGNLEKVKSSGSDYYKFCYEMGKEYFFKYEDSNGLNGLSYCQKWFDEVSKAGNVTGLDNKDIENATILNELSAAVCNIEGATNGARMKKVGGEDPVTGEVGYSYRDYYNDLVSILSLDIFDTSNKVTKTKVYGWIANLLDRHYSDLLKDGITVEEMRSTKEKALTDLNDLKSSKNNENWTETINNLITRYENIDSTWK